MSGSDDRTSREEAGAVGLALLLGGGVTEAIVSIEATLANAQSAAMRAFGKLSRVHAVGAAAAAVPPGPTQSRSVSPQAVEQIIPPANSRTAEPFALALAIPSAEAEQAATFAPVPVFAGGSTVPAAPAGPASQPGSAPVTFVSFAPLAPQPAPLPAAAQAGAIAAGSGWVPGALRSGADVRPWAPAVMTPAVMAPAARAAGVTPSADPLRAYAPPSSQGGQAGGPTGGDVFLDGARVGTWLADHLAREAGRPQTGSTGFDPRLTPAWPGTLQGS